MKTATRGGAAAAIAVAAFVASCTKPGARTPDAGAAADAVGSAATPKTAAVVMDGDRLIFVARMLSTGEVLGASSFALYRAKPEADAVFREIAMPQGKTVRNLCAAPRADVAGVVAEDGSFFLLRGGAGALEPIAEDAYACSFSENGGLVELRTTSGKLSYLDLATRKVLREVPARSGEGRISKDARWALANDQILSTNGGLPDVDVAGEAIGFVGGEALLFEGHAVALVDPLTRARRHVSVCDGAMRYDELLPRVVVACAGEVDVVSLPDLTKRTFPVPAPRGETFLLHPSRSGEVLHGFVRRDDAPDPGRWFSLDPSSRKVTKEDEPHDVRGYDGSPGVTERSEMRECWVCGASADHARFVVPPRYDGRGFRVVDASGDTVVRWGGVLHDDGARFRGRGFDVSSIAKTGETHTMRVGPAVAPEEDAGARARAPRNDVCPWEPRDARHLTLASGELWWSDDSPKVCLCKGERCTLPPEAPFVVPVDARPGAILALAGSAEVSQVHVFDETFAKRGVAMVEGACVGGRLHEDARGATVLCFDAPEAGARRAKGAYPWRATLVDVDVATGARTRLTHVSLRPGRHHVVAAGRRAVLLRSDHPMSGTWWDVVELGTGRMLVHLVTGAGASVATFADGTVEIVGDEKAASEAIRCASGDALAPFPSCRSAALVHGKLAIDL